MSEKLKKALANLTHEMAKHLMMTGPTVVMSQHDFSMICRYQTEVELELEGMDPAAHCPHFGKWIGGCRFEPRYDETARAGRGVDYEGPVGSLRRLMMLETYVRDVCTKCGRTVERAT